MTSDVRYLSNWLLANRMQEFVLSMRYNTLLMVGICVVSFINYDVPTQEFMFLNAQETKNQ